MPYAVTPQGRHAAAVVSLFLLPFLFFQLFEERASAALAEYFAEEDRAIRTSFAYTPLNEASPPLPPVLPYAPSPPPEPWPDAVVLSHWPVRGRDSLGGSTLGASTLDRMPHGMPSAGPSLVLQVIISGCSVAGMLFLTLITLMRTQPRLRPPPVHGTPVLQAIGIIPGQAVPAGGAPPPSAADDDDDEATEEHALAGTPAVRSGSGGGPPARASGDGSGEPLLGPCVSGQRVAPAAGDEPA